MKNNKNTWFEYKVI